MAWNEPGGNGKDPWGHRKNDGPPDLDEIIKKVQNKLNQWFGNNGNNGGRGDSGSSGESPTLNSTVLIVMGMVLVVVWLSFGFYIIQPAEQGVVTRFGKFLRTDGDGLHWHIPYPVEQVQKVNVEQVRAVPHKALMLTQDENIVEIELVAQYRVKDAKSYLFNVVDPDRTLLQATESALRSIVGTSKMDDVLTLERDRVAADTKLLTQQILDSYQTGLIVSGVNMQNAQPPNEVQKAFEDVIKAREDEERLKNKAQAYKNEIVQRAGGEADKLRQESQAYKSQVVAHAEGETQRFLSILSEYNKSPEVTRRRLYLDTMEAVLTNTSKIVMDTKHSNNLTILPLEQLLGVGGHGGGKSDPPLAEKTSGLPSWGERTVPSNSNNEDSRGRSSR
ncbi:MAG: FtsH protease activity modulator HflK [Thiotrichaceae bacterium]